MDGQIASVPDRPDDIAWDALLHLAIGVLIANEHGYIVFANSSACALLAPLYPVGVNLRTVFGLSGAPDDAALAEVAQAGIGAAPVRAVLADGRAIDCRTRLLDDGGSVISLLDVSGHVQGADAVRRDQLTGLGDRAGLRERTEAVLRRSSRSGAQIAVFCLGIDRFKAVNDTLGHTVGDELLVRVAERLRGSSRGGDEFALVQIDAVQPQGAEVLAARLVDLIGRPYVIDGHTVNIGASVGVAVSPQDGQAFNELLQHANLALHRSKKDGKGTFRFFQPEMNAASQARRMLELELRSALALGQFALAYQPQMQLETDGLVGFEALLRWRHPERGFVSPAEFLPVAEEIGLIDEIGEWVLKTACQEVAKWPQPVSIAVNISPIQFRGTRLLPAVRAALAASGLAPSQLELEIREGALLNHTDSVLRSLHELKSIGIRLSMDDFGTGYSSLSYLQKFPFDTVKIDQSFVRGADTKAECGAIVRAVAALGKSLGLTTMAEGVETTEQLERVRAAGCCAVQGYLTGRPLSPSDAVTLLRASLVPVAVDARH